jgi:hypothetical protein
MPKAAVIKPYKYKLPPRPRPDTRVHRVEAEQDGEVLTGQVRGQKASDLEERFARALDAHNLDFEFQPSYAAGKNIQGEIRLDFMVYLAGNLEQPVNVDGTWVHSSAEAKAKDAVQDARLDELLQGQALPVIRVPGKNYPGTTFDTQDETDEFVATYLVTGGAT